MSSERTNLKVRLLYSNHGRLNLSFQIVEELDIYMHFNLEETPVFWYHSFKWLFLFRSPHPKILYFIYLCQKCLLARAIGIPVSRRSGSQLATTLVASINVIISFFPFFSSPSRPFLIEWVLWSKKLFSESCREHPKI